MNGGTLIRIIPKTLFDFGYLAPGTTGQIIVAKAVNVIPYSFASLWIRVYQVSLGGTNSATIEATGALPSDDTQLSFLQGSSTTQSISGTPPLLVTKDVTTPLPPYLQIKVTGTQQPATPTYLGIEISIDLLVRCCG